MPVSRSEMRSGRSNQSIAAPRTDPGSRKSARLTAAPSTADATATTSGRMVVDVAPTTIAARKTISPAPMPEIQNCAARSPVAGENVARV
jgi:hypothetical protein